MAVFISSKTRPVKKVSASRMLARQQHEKMLTKLRSGVTSLNDQITIDRREARNSYLNITLNRNYTAGRQASTLTYDQQKMLQGVLGNAYCDNVCGLVVHEHGDRLNLERVTAETEKEQKWLDKLWQRSHFDDLQQRVARNSIRDGNYCIMVDWNHEENKLVYHREPWWDGDVGVFIGYDTYGNKLYAVKEWNTPLGKRRTIYYEGAIERYINLNGGSIWTPFTLFGDPVGIGGGPQPYTDVLPIPYVDPNTNEPLHIPISQFSNPGDEFENYGASILDGGKIGAQDQINDTQYDISAAARMTGYQRTYSKGYELQTINGKTVQPKTGPGVHYHSDSKDAAWGVLQAGSIAELAAVYDLKIKSFCRNTRTPHAAITGNWPSGEALYRQEKPIYGATLSRQKRQAPAWIETFHRSMELANIYDKADLDLDSMLTVVYSDAGDRDPLSVAMADLSMWQAADAAVAAGVPIETFLKVQGWGEKQLKGLTSDIANQIVVRQADLATTGGGGDVKRPVATGTTGQGGRTNNVKPPTKPKPSKT